jgi:hypothetical protein
MEIADQFLQSWNADPDPGESNKEALKKEENDKKLL